MAWGTVTVGGIVFRETFTLTDDGSLKLSGQEAHPPLTQADVRARHLNVIGLQGATVPVVFEDKSIADGFYVVTDASSDLFSFADGSVLTASWSMTLGRLGTERDVEFESRVPTIGRADTLAGSQVPEFWHAPPPDHIDYYTGATVPSATVTRASADGNVLVYRGLPSNFPPRWTCPAAGYEDAAAKVLLDGVRVRGVDTPSFVTWEINNGIVRVTGGSGATFTVSAWGGTGWVSSKLFAPQVNWSTLAGTPTLSILRNDTEEVTIRLTYPQAPGRVTVDFGLRRGSRFVSGVMKRNSANLLIISRADSGEPITRPTGGVRATSVDADGNRFVMGTAIDQGATFNADTSWGYIAHNGATSQDFFIGHEIGGSPAAGDAFADLLAQYLGTSGDRTRVVRR